MPATFQTLRRGNAKIKHSSCHFSVDILREWQNQIGQVQVIGSTKKCLSPFPTPYFVPFPGMARILMAYPSPRASQRLSGLMAKPSVPAGNLPTCLPVSAFKITLSDCVADFLLMTKRYFPLGLKMNLPPAKPATSGGV